MAATTYTQEVRCSADPARLFKALCFDGQDIFAVLLPNTFQGHEFIKGGRDTVGGVRKIYFGEGHPYKYAKYRLDEFDVTNLYCKLTTIEGGILSGKYEYIAQETKIVPSGIGSVCKQATHFMPVAGVALDEEDIEKQQENMNRMIKTLDVYLVANPQACA
ncbi:hypothetical protein Nepgr_032721 [Nepenthes gracilis]|uniref:Bet v I/Major latex protein domain-containing protein n=1 Tax=Nepenthes gracilis TaxID=150966 RepID=A0AAD3TKZ9_NEPGR|nr:hypothetical protein Nepgr_032721 [Nepenthes gracilis]